MKTQDFLKKVEETLSNNPQKLGTLLCDEAIVDFSNIENVIKNKDKDESSKIIRALEEELQRKLKNAGYGTVEPFEGFANNYADLLDEIKKLKKQYNLAV